MSKQSGKRQNYLNTVEGSSYSKVKKGLKKMITRIVRRALNRKAKDQE